MCVCVCERERERERGIERENGYPGEGRVGKRILIDSVTWSVALVMCSKPEWMIWSKGGQTAACHLFLYGSQIKGCFYIFK